MPVENHVHFTAVKSDVYENKQHYADLNMVEEVMMRMADCKLEDNLVSKDKIQLFVPTPTFNFLFIFSHITRHFQGLVLRHLLDWVCFLKANGDKYDTEIVRKTFEGLHLALPVEVFVRLAVRLFDLPENCDPQINIKHYDKRLEDKVLEHIFNPSLSIPRPQSRFLRIFWRAAFFFHNYWFNRFIYGENAFQQISYYFRRNKFKHIFS